MFDVCVIGSGAGAAPVVYELARAGFRVVVLEKGPYFTTDDFRKDEMACCRRDAYASSYLEEPQVIETPSGNGWEAVSTAVSGASFWNGNCVGGSSNLMSGYFHRMKPIDFRLLSEFGPVEKAAVADWPITYDDLEPYYTRCEHLIGISGKVVPYRWQEPRSTADFPYPPLEENIVSGWIDAAARRLGVAVIPTPRAILSRPAAGRNSCYYSNYCGSYGCASDAKGGARAALIEPALRTGRVDLRPLSHVFALESDGRHRVRRAWYFDAGGKRRSVAARIFVVACQAIETVRLLRISRNKEYPDGIGNGSGQLGRHLIFSAGGSGFGTFDYDALPAAARQALDRRGVFVNRSAVEWYVFDDPDTGRPIKGGIIDFLFAHDNPIRKALQQKWDGDRLVIGSELKRRLMAAFRGQRRLRFEVFVDWMPHADCYVDISRTVKDKWGLPVAKIRTGAHPHDLKVGRFLVQRAQEILRETGARDVTGHVSSYPPSNLQAGGCRFGTDPRTSVLDPWCRVHEADNLYVTDGSFMPTGGSVPYTWTIYANAFRVADAIRERL